MGWCARLHAFGLAVGVSLLLALCCCASSGSARPVDSPAKSSPVPRTVSQAVQTETKPTDRTETQQYTLSHDRYEKAIIYSRASYTLYFVSYITGALFLILILRLGVAAKFRDMAEAVSDRRWMQSLVFVPLLFFTLDILHLPLNIYWHALSLRNEQSVEPWGAWLSDWAKRELLRASFAIVIVLILFSVMRWSPRRWWLYFWFPAGLIMLGLFVMTPLVIDPLFNQFEPLNRRHADLVASIEKLTAKAGVPIPPDRMFLMVASQKTNVGDAYVTGLGASKRIVIWDTLIQKTPVEETLFIVGHEMGHYALAHVWKGFMYGAAGLLLALFLLFRGLYWALDWWGQDWKVCGAEDWVSLAVLLLLLQVLLFLSSPVSNGISRMEEHDADVYGLELIHGLVPNSEEVAAHAFQVLGELDLADPNPPRFIKFWLYSHPPLGDRLVFAHSYDPWSRGEAPKYVK
jgi:Zn-dependent protease with chaperone function